MAQARFKLPAGILSVGFPSKRDEAVLDASGSRSESVLYDFDTDGGAVSTITFGRNIPAGAIIKAITTDEQTVLTSGGLATITVKAGSTDLTADTAFDTGFSGISTIALTNVAGIKISTESEIGIEIKVAALTAGKVQFYIEYLLPNN